MLNQLETELAELETLLQKNEDLLFTIWESEQKRSALTKEIKNQIYKTKKLLAKEMTYDPEKS